MKNFEGMTDKEIAETIIEYHRLEKFVFGNTKHWNTNAYAWPIEYWRDRKGMSQEDLAEKAEVSKATISRAERGLPISRKTFNIIARGLEVNPLLIRINLITPNSKEQEDLNLHEMFKLIGLAAKNKEDQ